jgi:Gram-negative bacterial TonB protein C-terminal
LTADERQRVKSQYEAMAESDEPPYPLHGLHKIVEASVALQKKRSPRGQLVLAVTVNAAGDAISVEVLKSPDSETARAMAAVLMLEKYKPAVCKGVPCKMQFPFRINYRDM